jgi:hypothetical protein
MLPHILVVLVLAEKIKKLIQKRAFEEIIFSRSSQDSSLQFLTTYCQNIPL